MAKERSQAAGGRRASAGEVRSPPLVTGISMHTTHIHSLSALDRVVAEGYDRQEQEISDGVSGIAGKLPN